jgi:hypothetical protein
MALSRHSFCVPAFSGCHRDSSTRVEAHVGPINECDMIDWFQFLGDNVLDVPCSDEEQDVREVNTLVTAEDDSDCEVQYADKDTSLVENNRASDASFHVNECTPAEGYHALDDKPASSRDKDASLSEDEQINDLPFENNRASDASFRYHALDDKPASSREHEVCSGGQHKTFVKRHCKVVKQALNKWIRCFPAPYVCHEEKKRIADILHVSVEQVTTFCNNYRKRFAMVNKKNMSYTTAHRSNWLGAPDSE